MPEYLKHIRKDAHKTHCGLWNQGLWLFENLGHAELTILMEGRLLPCETCLKAARKEFMAKLGSTELFFRPPQESTAGVVWARVDGVTFSFISTTVAEYNKHTDLMARMLVGLNIPCKVRDTHAP